VSSQLSCSNSDISSDLNQKLRKIAQMLEEKSERLFDLKKQQQQLLVRDTMKESQETGFKQYQVKQNYC
jgi:hypothetical protein